MKASGSKIPLTSAQITKIKAEAQEWVENGIKASTNRRLTVLRAMFNYAAENQIIKTADIPASFCLAKGVANVRTNKFSKEMFEKILKQLSTNLHPLLIFLYVTGMRSGQAKKITWDMIDENQVLIVPGIRTKSGQPYSLPLVNKKGEPYHFTTKIVNTKEHPQTSARYSSLRRHESPKRVEACMR